MNINDAGLKFNTLQKRTKTSAIIIHHSGSDEDDIFTIHRYHQEDLGWSGVGYHIVIHRDGTAYRGRPIDTIGAHTLGHNTDTIGICVCGNLDVHPMSEAQESTLRGILASLRHDNLALKIERHRDKRRTSCPGKFFNDNIILDALAIEKEHWAEKHFRSLKADGILIHERRFDDRTTRGEMFALLAQIVKK